MKKFFTIVLMVALVASTLFATDNFLEENPGAYESIGKKAYAPTNVALVGMGNAGLAFNHSAEGLFMNPAALGSHEFQLSLPSVAVTANHVYDFFKGGEDSIYCKSVREAKKEDPNFTSIMMDVVGACGYTYSDLLSVNAAGSIVMPFGLGLGLAATDTVHTVEGSVIDELNASAVIGYGSGVDLGIGRINIGLAMKFNYLAFDRRIATGDVVDMLNGDTSYGDTPIAIGYALPLDIGLQFKTTSGFSIGAAVTNINGNYKMNFTNLDALVDNLSNNPSKLVPGEAAFVIESKPVISAGIAYEKKGIINTKMAADLVDINGFIDEYQDESLLMRTAMKHLNAGVEVNFGNALAARAGISQGYMSLGTSFNLMLLRVDAAYYWKEMGDVAGQRGLDCFTIRFNLGFER